MQTRQNKRFDQESETEKENLQSLGENISHNINYAELKQLLRDKKKRFKQFREFFRKFTFVEICLIT